MPKGKIPFNQNRFSQLTRWIIFLVLLVLIFDAGFEQYDQIKPIQKWLYAGVGVLGIVRICWRFWKRSSSIQRKVFIIDTFIFLYLVTAIIIMIFRFMRPFQIEVALALAVILVFIREFSSIRLSFGKKHVNPAQIFAGSFALIILLGSFLLMLPNATNMKLGFIDALFTSTSAVCVTGLATVDTGTHFTVFGQIIIMMLIQIGAIGVMTFTSYFSYFFRGGISYENQLMLKNLTNVQKVTEVFATLKKILLLTFGIELVGMVMIYFTLDSNYFESFGDEVFFAAFHSVSGFCNAGFSTLGESMYQEAFRFNYSLHLIISGLFILGGIGFPIMFNFVRYLRYQVKQKINFILRFKPVKYKPWILNVNTRLTIWTTGILIVTGTLLFFFFEYDNTLKEHNFFGKIVTAFFGAVTPRTAGFNTVDTSALAFPSIMLVILLMWIGASPGSTGGGIKTSTFALATLNFLNLARGKDKVEIFKRRVSEKSIQRAFAIVTLSFVVIGTSIFFLALFEKEKSLLSIAFEAFSAYSTVGLSLGITGELSEASKLVLICTMFIGRVSMLTILIAFLRRMKHSRYTYPTEEILIN